MKEDKEKSRIAGCDAYIAKPLNYRELFAAIDRLLLERVPRTDGSEVNGNEPW
jgi:two-component system cell cycle response regulator DivK